MTNRKINRVFWNDEQYVSFYDIIQAIRAIAEDFHEEDMLEARDALEWVAEQLQFSMITDGIINEQKQN